MKKFATVLLILMTLVFSTFIATPTFAVNVFKEGVYKAEDLNLSANETYDVKNISPADNAYLLLFDGNQLLIQSIRLEPRSAKYNLIPLKPDYRLVIVGNGQIYIDKGTQ